MLVGLLINMTVYGALFVLGLYFQTTKHWAAWLSGIAFLPLPVMLGTANVAANYLSERLGAAVCMAAGLLVAACGSVVMSGFDGATPYGLILLGLTLFPAGIGVAVPVMTASLLGSVPRDRAGVAAGTLNAVRQAGGAIGVALFGGMPTEAAFQVGTGLLIAAAVVAACLIRPAQPAQQPAGAPAAG
jgi:MFS transporter, DHA2 family, methylenomycin A resistance protein